MEECSLLSRAIFVILSYNSALTLELILNLKTILIFGVYVDGDDDDEVAFSNCGHSASHKLS